MLFTAFRPPNLKEESRMRFANATKLHRKSGGSPSFLFLYARCRPVVKALEKGRLQPMYAKTRTWGTRPGAKAGWQAGKAADGMTANTRIAHFRNGGIPGLHPGAFSAVPTG